MNCNSLIKQQENVFFFFKSFSVYTFLKHSGQSCLRRWTKATGTLGGRRGHSLSNCSVHQKALDLRFSWQPFAMASPNGAQVILVSSSEIYPR